MESEDSLPCRHLFHTHVPYSTLSFHTRLDLSFSCFWTKVYVFLTLICVLHVLSISFIGSHLRGKLVTGTHLLHIKRHKCELGHSPASVKNTWIFSFSHQIRLRRGVCTQRQFDWLLEQPPLAPVHLTKRSWKPAQCTASLGCDARVRPWSRC